MSTINRGDLRQLVARQARCYQPITTTAAGLSDGTTVVDSTRFRDQQLSAFTYRNALILATSGTAAGEIRRVKSYAPDAGAFTVTPPFSAQIASSVSAELYTLPVLQTGTCDGVEKELIHQAIDDGLVDSRYFWRHYLTLITDGDMEASGVTSWTASNATLTKSTTTVGEGKQSLRVANTAGNGYAQSASVGVFQDETYLFEATVYIASGTAQAVLIDVTNGNAVIDTLTLSNALGYTQTNAWARAWRQFTPPSGCFQVAVRLRGVESNADVYWENVILRRAYSRRETLPSWVMDANNIKQFVTRPLGDRYGRERWQVYPVRPEAIIQHPALTAQEWEHEPFGVVVAVEGYRPSGPLTTTGTAFATNDAVTVVGNEDEILSLCMVQLYDKLSARLGDNTAYNQKRAEWAAKVSAYTRKRAPRDGQPLPQRRMLYKSEYWA